jgi:hypothetical protein
MLPLSGEDFSSDSSCSSGVGWGRAHYLACCQYCPFTTNVHIRTKSYSPITKLASKFWFGTFPLRLIQSVMALHCFYNHSTFYVSFSWSPMYVQNASQSVSRLSHYGFGIFHFSLLGFRFARAIVTTISLSWFLELDGDMISVQRRRPSNGATDFHYPAKLIELHRRDVGSSLAKRNLQVEISARELEFQGRLGK